MNVQPKRIKIQQIALFFKMFISIQIQKISGQEISR
jgi:hypothetical protein